MKYRKKPVVIEAVQWTGENLDQITAFISPHCEFGVGQGDLAGTLSIVTLEGPMCASSGDFIIRGVKGEFYPCKPDIFAATHEPAE